MQNQRRNSNNDSNYSNSSRREGQDRSFSQSLDREPQDRTSQGRYSSDRFSGRYSQDSDSGYNQDRGDRNSWQARRDSSSSFDPSYNDVESARENRSRYGSDEGSGRGYDFDRASDMDSLRTSQGSNYYGPDAARPRYNSSSRSEMNYGSDRYDQYDRSYERSPSQERSSSSTSGRWNPTSESTNGSSSYDSGRLTTGRSSYSPSSSSDKSYSGRGPKSYNRSDDRIKEDVCEMLTRHSSIDASEVDVEVKDGVVTLSGAVSDRRMKHMAEDIAEQSYSVKDVINNIRVQKDLTSSKDDSSLNSDRSSASSTSGSSAGSTSSKKSGTTSTTNPNH